MIFREFDIVYNASRGTVGLLIGDVNRRFAFAVYSQIALKWKLTEIPSHDALNKLFCLKTRLGNSGIYGEWPHIEALSRTTATEREKFLLACLC